MANDSSQTPPQFLLDLPIRQMRNKYWMLGTANRKLQSEISRLSEFLDHLEFFPLIQETQSP